MIRAVCFDVAGVLTAPIGPAFVGQAQKADGILAAREHQRRSLEFRGDLTHDVDAFGLEVLQVVEVIRIHWGKGG